MVFPLSSVLCALTSLPLVDSVLSALPHECAYISHGDKTVTGSDHSGRHTQLCEPYLSHRSMLNCDLVVFNYCATKEVVSAAPSVMTAIILNA